ncbi:MAG: ubiquinone biosynthesis protein [Cyanobacteria bacterium CRU_2_1]|nr:ubiquinone biosynthesis protein [Cyanobacteria bacterium RU_5_0]NJR59359.1 ubiquinone biosynthesis protein [Cyanobacteria bacterium CRU_2_1]
MNLLNLLNQPSDAEIQHQIHFQMLIILKSFTAMLAGDGGLESVGELTAALVETPASDRAAKSLKSDPESSALIQERYIAPPHNLDMLLQCPPDSLGRIYATRMKTQGFDPDLYSHMKIDSDASYVEARLSQTHDIWHIVTGFDVSPVGEIGLQAFHLPQFPYPLAAMLIANALVSSTLLAPNELPKLIQAIAQGLEMGRIAKSLFAQRWEEGWDKPLSEWQAELNIRPIC